jgi:hypothetical protein
LNEIEDLKSGILMFKSDIKHLYILLNNIKQKVNTEEKFKNYSNELYGCLKKMTKKADEIRNKSKDI